MVPVTGLRAELRSSKKQAIAANLTLTDAEATKFWPVYDRYAADLTKIKDDHLLMEQEAYLKKLRERTPVWTMFDPPPPNNVAAGAMPGGNTQR